MRFTDLARVLVPVSLAFAAAGCSGGGGGGGGGDDDDDDAGGRVEIDLQVPPTGIPGQDPFADLTDYRVLVLDSAGGTLVDQTFPVSDPVEIAAIPEGPDRVVVFEGLDAGTAVSRGRTLPVDFVEGETTTATIYFSRIGVFSTVGGAATPRFGPAVHAFSDGRVLIAGGLDTSGTAILTAELYEWTTNEVSGAGSMASGHALAPVVPLGNDTILIAGGLDGASPTDAADVYEHATSGAGTWTAAPAMTGGARREHAAVELGAGRAFLAGGAATNDTAGPPLDTTLLFEWDGATGTWTDGPLMNEPRMGAIGLAASGGIAIIAGGFTDNNNDGGGPNDFSRSYDVFTWNGAAIDEDLGVANDISPRRGWTAVISTGTDEWIVLGGEAGFVGHTLLPDAQRYTFDGGTLSFEALDDLPSAQRGGGGGILADGRILVLGGLSTTYPTDTGTTFAAIYDPLEDAFSPVNGGLPGGSATGFVHALPDGTALVVIDGGVYRFNPE